MAGKNIPTEFQFQTEFAHDACNLVSVLGVVHIQGTRRRQESNRGAFRNRSREYRVPSCIQEAAGGRRGGQGEPEEEQELEHLEAGRVGWIFSPPMLFVHSLCLLSRKVNFKLTYLCSSLGDVGVFRQIFIKWFISTG